MEFWQYSAGDMANFGDVLYPILLRRYLTAAGDDLAGNYGFLEGTGPLLAPYTNHAVRDLFAPDTARRQRLIIGGGDILRLDDEVVASHYPAPSPAGPASFAQLFAPTPTVPPARLFRTKYMPPSEGAFLLSPDRCPALAATAFFSAGVPFEFAAEQQPSVRAVFDSARYIYLRDEISADKLQRAGVTQSIEVAPDFAIGVSHFFPTASLAGAAQRLLTAAGHNFGRPYVCFQCSQVTLPWLGVILQQLQAYAAAAGIDVVLLPLGFCHGDHLALAQLAHASGKRFKQVAPQTVEDMLAVLAHAAAFAGISMHGNICARSYGVPHLFGMLTGVDKIEGALRILGAAPTQRINDWRELATALHALRELDRAQIQESADRAWTQAEAATKRLLSALAA